MSVEQLEASLLKLPPAERRQFAEWFEIHRAELMADAERISPDVRDELELRLREMDEHPGMLEPFGEEDLERMIQKAADAHDKKTSARRS